jgi:hypothetical protein
MKKGGVMPSVNIDTGHASHSPHHLSNFRPVVCIYASAGPANPQSALSGRPKKAFLRSFAAAAPEDRTHFILEMT